uniref:Putative terminase n=1 Tax=viral metagenome TaxID=1070528 RepID=A0A6M3IDM5_9ZZZZ
MTATSDFAFFPTQAKFFHSNAANVALFSGAGFGKSEVLCAKVARNVTMQDGWWEGLGADARYKPLIFIVGAPNHKYLHNRTMPGVRQWLDRLERMSGRRIRAYSGRAKDGFYGGGMPYQDCLNGVRITFESLHNESSAVATDAASVFVDEGTMLSRASIWNRLSQRVRDTRARLLQKAVVGTPEVDHFLFDFFFEAEGIPRASDEDGYNCEVFTASSYENPYLPDSWFSDVATTASSEFIKMQVEGEWVKGAGGQRFAKVFDTAAHCIPMNISPTNKFAKFFFGVDPGFATGSWLMFWHAAKSDEWWLVDEIVVRGMTTEEAALEAKRRGYGRHNISRLCIDVDARKQNRQTKKTDMDIIRDVLGVRPVPSAGANAPITRNLRLREDYISSLLERGRLLINERLVPRSRTSLGVVNALRNYSLRKVPDEEGLLEDKPTPETMRKWKHPIDAIFYLLQRADRKTVDRMMIRYDNVPRSRAKRMGY